MNSVQGGDLEKIPDEVMEGVPDAHKKSVQKAITAYAQVTHESYTSPVPPPHILRQYEDIIPGFSNRLLVLVENQQAHRHSLEQSVIRSNILNEKLGLAAAFILATILSVGSIHLINTGRDVAGLGIILVEITALAGIFLYGRWRQEKERKAQIQALREPPNKQPQASQSPQRSKKNSRKGRRRR